MFNFSSKIVQTIFLIFCLTNFTVAQDLVITGKNVAVIDINKTIVVKQQATLVSALPCTITAPANYLFYGWNVPSSINYKKKSNVITILAAPEGEVTISVEMTVIDFKNQTVSTKDLEITFIVGKITPSPVPVPVPPTPVIFDKKCLILYESSVALPPKQQVILTSQEIRQYLNSKCSLGAEGTKDWRIWDKDTDPSGDSQPFIDAMKRPRSSIPWIIVGNFAGPLPNSVEELLILLKKELP